MVLKSYYISEYEFEFLFYIIYYIVVYYVFQNFWITTFEFAPIWYNWEIFYLSNFGMLYYSIFMHTLFQSVSDYAMSQIWFSHHMFTWKVRSDGRFGVEYIGPLLLRNTI